MELKITQTNKAKHHLEDSIALIYKPFISGSRKYKLLCFPPNLCCLILKPWYILQRGRIVSTCAHFRFSNENKADQKASDTDTVFSTLFLAVLLLFHGHKCRKVSLIIGEPRRGAVTLAETPKGSQIPLKRRGKCISPFWNGFMICACEWLRTSLKFSKLWYKHTKR